jgi:hypothetical protein
LAGGGDANVRGAELAQFCADNGLRKFGFVAVAAEVGEDKMTEPVADDFGGHGGGGVVVKVAMPAHDALFGGPRADGVFLKHFNVVIGFENEQVELPDAFDDEFGGVAEVGDDADRVSAVVDRERDGVMGIVRDTERFDGQVADGEGVAVGEDAPRDADAIGPIGFVIDGLGGEAVGVHGEREPFAEGAEAADVVRMFMGDKDGVEVLELAAEGGETLRDLAAAEAGIHEDGGLVGFDKGAITGAAAAQNCDLNPHGRDITPRDRRLKRNSVSKRVWKLELTDCQK